jgi:hypothetical protein
MAWPASNNRAFALEISSSTSGCRIANMSFTVCAGGADVTNRTFHARVYAKPEPGYPASTTAQMWLAGPSPQISDAVTFTMGSATTVSIPINRYSGELSDMGIAIQPAVDWYGYLYVDDAYIN